MKNDKAYQLAKKRVHLKLGFKKHLAVYVGVMLLLLFINLYSSSDGLWVQWPAFGWGIGLFFHGLKAYILPNSETIADEMIIEEMENEEYL